MRRISARIPTDGTSPAAPPERLYRVLWRYRYATVLVVAGVLAGLIIATLLHDPAPRTGLPIQPGTVDTAIAPVTEMNTPAAAPTARPSARPSSAARRNGRVAPGEISIPQIGVRSSFVHLGLNRDRTLQVPTRFDVVGWYSGGPAPGDAGGPPAVLAGHVDSKAGPGVFYRLHELTIGSKFVIGGTDGADRHFRVYKTATFRKNAFPAKQVYAPTTGAEVRLITCTGTFNSTTGHYEGNFVIYASMVEG